MTRSSSRPEDLLLGVMGILDIQFSEEECRAQQSDILNAFTRDLAKDKMSGDCFLAFQTSLRLLDERNLELPPQWQMYRNHFLKHIPLLDGSIEPSELNDSGIGGFVDEENGCRYFLGAVFGLEESTCRCFLRPCRVTASDAKEFSCMFVNEHGVEEDYEGKWALFPFDQERMEWTCTDNGFLSTQHKPITAGYELDLEGCKTYCHFSRCRIDGHSYFGRTYKGYPIQHPMGLLDKSEVEGSFTVCCLMQPK